MTRTIRTLALAEVETLVSWAAAEGWNPGAGDAPAFHAADPDGFLGAFVGDEMVAGISAVAYGSSFGFIGLFICRPDRRGQGHGRAVWDAALARLGNRTIGLDGVPALQATYAGMGFVKTYETIRLTGTPSAADGPVTAIGDDLGPAIVDLDRECFPGPRAAFLDAWLKPPRVALATLDAGTLTGYGAVRPCLDGHKIGPLYARSPDAAMSLLSALAARAGGPVQIDVPVSQSALIEALTTAGMTPGFSTARMYRGPAPAIARAQVYGISTLELG